MNATDSEKVICAACGAPSDQMVVTTHASTGTSNDEPDLDTRPGPPVRSTLSSWIQQCPHCGYAADQVGKIVEGVHEIVTGEHYRNLAQDPGFPSQARPFLCYSYILEQLRALPDAGWCALHAAWMCDDLNQSQQARECRALAIELWREGKVLGSGFMDSHAEEFAVAADLLRRIGEFEHARLACNAALDGKEDGPALPADIEALLRFQLVLIASADVGAHTLQQVPAPPAGGQRLVP